MLTTKFFKKAFICQCLDLIKYNVARHATANTAEAYPLRKRKSKSQLDNTIQHYVDRCRVRTVGGNGGNGSVSFLSAWCNEEAGPDGGDGGSGGHVLFYCTKEVKSLNHCHSVQEAKHGEKGSTKNCDGKNAKHNIIKVPIGTIVKDLHGKVVADLDSEGMMFVAARGGAGGKGNKFFTTSTFQAPEIAEFGATGEQNIYILEIRSMAHVGLLGFPNAGKSTLLRAISRARPEVAAYPFTTLNPHIGMVQYDDYEQIAVADLPGLIPGSHLNKGLGIQFLQHAERCCCLLFMIDASVPQPWDQLECLQFELSQFNKELLERPRLIIANKMDLPAAQENLPQLKDHFPNLEIMPLSAKMGTNLANLLKAIRKIHDGVKIAIANNS